MKTLLFSLLLFVSAATLSQEIPQNQAIIPGISGSKTSVDSTSLLAPTKGTSSINNRPLIILDGGQFPFEKYKSIRDNSIFESIMNLNKEAAEIRYPGNGKYGVIIVTSKSYATTVKENDPDADRSVFSLAEKMPEFNGGTNALINYIKQSLHYPPRAAEQGFSGNVIVNFIINLDGQIVNAKVIRGVASELDAEALRVINQMPNWKPGTNKGRPVNVSFTLPIRFVFQ